VSLVTLACWVVAWRRRLRADGILGRAGRASRAARAGRGSRVGRTGRA
jgi:hypothetical protein